MHGIINRKQFGELAERLNAPVLARDVCALAQANLSKGCLDKLSRDAARRSQNRQRQSVVPRRVGRAVECTGLENRQGRKILVSSNLTLSASQAHGWIARSMRILRVILWLSRASLPELC